MDEHKPLLVNGFDDCIVGIIERAGMKPIYCYNKLKIVTQLMEREKLSFEEAVEHYEYNIVGAWMGEGTPCFLTDEVDFL